MESQLAKKRRKRVKLIFNAGSGITAESSKQLMDVTKEMQAWNFIPETYLIEPNCDLNSVIRDAAAQGIRMIVVCGGDGTIASVATAMLGTNTTLGIIPTGTQNNIALSLGIPADIPAAIAILRAGKRLKMDVGMVNNAEVITPFIEICSVGLFSTLFSSVDDIQHGEISRVGDFLTVLSTSPPSQMRLLLDDKQEIEKLGHVVLVSNMPYAGRHYQVGAADAFHDGLLDVLFFADLSKLDLIGYVLKGPGASAWEDPRIQHFRVRSIVIDTQPAMPLMADGVALGEGLVRIDVRKHALAVMVGTIAPNEPVKSGDTIEK